MRISQEDKELFKEARRSFLFHHETAYVKKKNPDFDVAMGAYDGADACELVGHQGKPRFEEGILRSVQR